MKTAESPGTQVLADAVADPTFIFEFKELSP
jgi:hypothetical protein